MVSYKHIVLFSGGIDSMALILYLWDLGVSTRDIIGVHAYAPGSRQKKEELKAVQMLLWRGKFRVEVVDLDVKFGKEVALGRESKEEAPSDHSDMSKLVVPFRNPLLISCALNKVMSLGEVMGAVYIGATGESFRYPDSTSSFLSAMKGVVSEGTDEKFDLKAPFKHWSKNKIVELFKDREDFLWLTYTCYRGTSPQCGQCVACVGRQKAIKEVIGEDETPYKAKPQ